MRMALAQWMDQLPRLIVARHPAAVAYIRATLPGWEDVEAVASATADQVRGRWVAGALPAHLAACAAVYTAVVFDTPPRGAEYDIAAMEAAGARLDHYVVRPLDVYDHLFRAAQESVPTASW